MAAPAASADATAWAAAPPVATAFRRVRWLLVTLVNTIIASTVISRFDATIQQMVALAILMPIVASLGGNAGTQTMTVTVRALAYIAAGHAQHHFELLKAGFAKEAGTGR